MSFGALLLAACDEVSSPLPPLADASDAGNPDSPTPDTTDDGATTDSVHRDAGCTCKRVDDPEIRPNGSRYETSLPCLCEMHPSFFCPASASEAHAWISNSRATGAVVKTYQGCGLVEYRFRFGNGFNDIRWIFDRTSGNLVGNLWDGDLCDISCGCTTRAGIFPDASCVPTSEEPLCTRAEPQPCGDGGSDPLPDGAPDDATLDAQGDASEADGAAPDAPGDASEPDGATPDAQGDPSDGTSHPVDGDAGCTCAQVDDPEIRPDGKVHETSLACLCELHRGFGCPASPPEARALILNCAASRALVKTYQGCGLVEYRFHIGLGFNDARWIYDLGSGNLVGDLWDRDGCNLSCGCTTRAGLFPAAHCVVTSEETLCPKFGPQPCVDGGDDGS